MAKPKSNAAEVVVEAPKYKKTLVFKTTDNHWHNVRCGNYTFQRVATQEGGPIVLTLLKGPDRKDAENEPLHMIGGVISFHVFDGDNPDMSEIESLTKSGHVHTPTGLEVQG